MLLTALLSLSVAACAAPPVAAADTLEIREWEVPWEESRPRDPYVESADRVWFVGQRADYAALLNPSTGEFKRYDLPEGAGPHNLIVGDDGAVWYAGNRDRHIGKLDPATGEITRYAMPDSAARDPHTLTWGEDGAIWFTVQGGNFVGRMNPETGDVKLVRVPTPNARPYGIVIDAQGRPWIDEFGTNKIGTIDPATMELEEIALPREAARPRRGAITSDGAVWYVDYAKGYLGRLDPATRQVREWQLPGGEGSRPYAMTVDDKDRLWMVETGSDPNRFVGFDPETEEFFGETAVPSGGGTVRHMVFYEPTRTIWFGTDTNTIGSAKVPE